MPEGEGRIVSRLLRRRRGGMPEGEGRILLWERSRLLCFTGLIPGANRLHKYRVTREKNRRLAGLSHHVPIFFCFFVFKPETQKNRPGPGRNPGLVRWVAWKLRGNSKAKITPFESFICLLVPKNKGDKRWSNGDKTWHQKWSKRDPQSQIPNSPTRKSPISACFRVNFAYFGTKTHLFACKLP